MVNGDVMLDRFKGTMLGCAVGDSVGGVIELLNAVVVERDPESLAARSPLPSVTVDLTSNALTMVALAQAITELGKFDRIHFAEKLARLYENSEKGLRRVRYMDEDTEDASRALAEGASPEESGIETDSCEAAVRACAIGMRYYDDPRELYEAAVSQASLTHKGDEAAAGAVAIARAISLCLTCEEDLDVPAFLSGVASSIEKLSEPMSEKIAGLDSFLDAPPRQAFDRLGSRPGAFSAIPGAIYSFLRTLDDFVGSVGFATNLGGVAAARAAMAGSLGGALNGLSAIPPQMLETLVGADYVEGLAQRLFTLTPAAKPPVRRI
ncbi:MAG: ADP-ribosylglycohydrolase family protein [Actinomycetota bacterium]